MTGVEPNSIAEVVGILQLWAVKPGRGLALVEFFSEAVRRQALQQLMQTSEFDFEELSFHSSGDIERDVREMVERVRKSEKRVVSIRGLEDAFPMGAEREKAIDTLNFLRETIAANNSRQLWWLTHDGMRLLRQRARDLYSWFLLRLELTEELPVPARRPEAKIENPISLESARAHLADSIARIQKSMEAGADSADIWASLAYPALNDLRRAGATDEVAAARELLLETIYGPSHDSSRLHQVGVDLNILIRRGAYDAAAGLSGPEGDFDPQTATRMHGIESIMEFAHASLMADRYKEAAFHYHQAMEVSEKSFGVDHPLTLTAINGLAVTYFYLGKYDESEKLHLRALAGKERVLGKEDFDTLITVENLARLYEMQQRYEEAARLYLRVLSANERSVGFNHPKTLRLAKIIADLYRLQGRKIEAEQLDLRARAGQEKVLR